MRNGLAVFCLLLTSATADVMDRIAVAVGNKAIKESQIDRDIRLTAFLNGTPLESGGGSKRRAADRLVDQTVIRLEMVKGSYPAASDAEVKEVLAKIKQARFHTNAEYEQSLRSYGITEPELKSHIAWQIQVLRFVEVRFAPRAAAGDNRAFFAWLDESRKRSRIQFHDEVFQ